MKQEMNRQIITRHIKELGATNCRFIPSRFLIPEERIRHYCREDKCGCYGRHLMCPPNTETVSEVRRKLIKFKSGILIQYSENLDVKNDIKGLRKTKLKLHKIILETERYLEEEMGFENTLGMIGGTCELCDECAGYKGEGCMYPEKARTSLEALAIDVISLQKKLNLDGAFYKDKITWTGMIMVEGDF